MVENSDAYRVVVFNVDANVELAARMNDLTVKMADTSDTITRLAEESRAADQQLGARIEALVSAIGQFLTRPQVQ